MAAADAAAEFEGWMTMSFLTDFFRRLGLTISLPPRVADQPQAFAGMDMLAYPGDDFLRYFQNVTNIKWTCAYMVAPGHADSTWALGGGKNAMTLGFGIAATYLGHQDPTFPNKPHDLQPATGSANGLHAVQQAAAMGLPDHAVLYLDWEAGNKIDSSGIAYCVAWLSAITEAGFRPGLYAHSLSSMEMRKAWPDLFVWVPVPRMKFEETWAIDKDSARVKVKDPRDSVDVNGNVDPDTVACQMWWKKKSPWPPSTTFPKPTNTALPIPTQFVAFKYSTFTAVRHPSFDMDVSSSSMKDPSFPEATVSPGLVRGGKAGAQVLSDTSIALFRVRGGKLDAVQSGGTAPIWTGLSVDNVARRLTFHPWSPPRALRRGTAGDLAVITRSGTFGTAEDRWNLYAYRRRGTTWTVDEAINGSTVVSPLLGLCVVSRAPDAFEVVFQGYDPQVQGHPLHLYAVSTADTQPQGDNQPWTTPTPVPVPAGFSPSRVGGLGAVSRANGLADFFTVGKTTTDPVWRLYWTRSTAPASFAAAFALPISPDPVAKVHPFSNVAAVSRAPNFVDAFAIAMGPNSPNWRVYHWYWSATDGWGVSPNIHIEAIGGTQNLPHPVSKLAAVAYTTQSAQCIDVFAVGASDGFLYFSRWDGASWRNFTRIGADNVTLASVDAAILRSPNIVDVIATGRDGNVYVSTSTGDMADYTSLAKIAELALAPI